MRNILLLLAVALASPAHHSLDAEFDRAGLTEYNVKVVAVTWVNPHATFTAEVASAGAASVLWTFEMAPPNTLQRLGWTRETLQAGDAVTVSAYPAKSGAPRATAKQVFWPNGMNLDCADSWMWTQRPANGKQ